MRIAFFTNNYLPRPSGVAHAIENLRIELENLGHDVFVFAPRYSKKDKENAKLFRYKSFVTHEKLGPLSSIPFPHSPKIKKHIQELAIDIIHSHHPYLLGKTAQKYAKELNVPLIFTLHTPYYQYLAPLAGSFGQMLDSFLLEILSKYANKCGAVIVPTRAVKETIKHAKINPPVYILPSGIDINKFSQCKKLKNKQNLGFTPSDVILLTVARLSYEKNVDFIIEAFSQITKFTDRVNLIIVGGGSQKLKLQSLVKSLGLKNKVIFTGKLPYKKLPVYYGASDILLYSSLVDTQGLALCEAMASGLPIVSTNQAAGPRSLIKNDKIGYLVPPDTNAFSQKVLELINNKEKRQEFGLNAKKEAKKYDRKLLAKKLEKIYMNLAKND